MEAKWHTYWQNPGEAGLATAIEWALPEGFHAGPIQWPHPKRFNDSGIISQGYADEVTLLTKIDVDDSVSADEEVELQARVRWLVCKEICLPGEADLKLTIPVRGQTPKIEARWTKRFTETRSNLPLTKTNWLFNADMSETNTIELLAMPPDFFNSDLGKVVFFP